MSQCLIRGQAPAFGRDVRTPDVRLLSSSARRWRNELKVASNHTRLTRVDRPRCKCPLPGRQIRQKEEQYFNVTSNAMWPTGAAPRLIARFAYTGQSTGGGVLGIAFRKLRIRCRKCHKRVSRVRSRRIVV
jgi:hypothetical protein